MVVGFINNKYVYPIKTIWEKALVLIWGFETRDNCKTSYREKPRLVI